MSNLPESKSGVDGDVAKVSHGDQPSKSFLLGPWRVFPQQLTIERDHGVNRKLEPKIMDLLVFMMRYPEQTLGRHLLLQAVWPETAVIGKALDRAISQLRKALGDDPRSPQFIETVPKRGYRLIAQVAVVGGNRVSRPPEKSPGLVLRPKRWLSFREEMAGCLPHVAVGAAILVWLFFSQAKNQPDPAETNRVFDAVPLTSHPKWEYDPQLSPDGSHLLYAWCGPEGASWDLFSLPGDGSPPRLEVGLPGAEGSPRFSKDGSKLAYYRHRPEGTALFWKPFPKGPESLVTTCNIDYPDLDWLANGKTLIYHQRIGHGSPHALFTVDLDSGQSRQISNPPAGCWGDFAVSVSPAGDQMAFCRAFSESVQDVFLLDLESGKETRLTYDGRNIRGLTWMDNNLLIMASNRLGPFDLWLLRLDRVSVEKKVGNPEMLRFNLAGWQPGSPTFASGRVVFVRWASDTNLWKLPLGKGDAVPVGPLAPGNGWELHPAVSQNGDVAFISNRTGAMELWVSDANGLMVRQLTRFGGPFTASPAWFGGKLAFSARKHHQADIFMLENGSPSGAGFAAPRRMTQDPGEELAPFWPPDGQKLYFSANRDGRWQIYRKPLGKTGDSWEQVTANGGFRGRFGTGGQVLYFSKFNQPGLWQMPAGGGPERLLFKELAIEDYASWVPAPGGIYFVRRHRRPQKDELAFYDLKTRKTTRVFVPVSIPKNDPVLSLTPDSQFLIFGQVDRADSDLFQVNLWQLMIKKWLGT